MINQSIYALEKLSTGRGMSRTHPLQQSHTYYPSFNCNVGCIVMSRTHFLLHVIDPSISGNRNSHAHKQKAHGLQWVHFCDALPNDLKHNGASVLTIIISLCLQIKSEAYCTFTLTSIRQQKLWQCSHIQYTLIAGYDVVHVCTSQYTICLCAHKYLYGSIHSRRSIIR